MSFHRPAKPSGRETEPDPTQPLANEDSELEPKARFALGQVVATPGALEAFSQAGQDPIEFLNRHVRGDWGELEAEDLQENELSVEKRYRLLSSSLSGQQNSAIRGNLHIFFERQRRRLFCL